MALIQYSFRSEVLKENTEIYVILPTYERGASGDCGEYIPIDA